MGTGSRIAVLVALVAAAVLAFVLIRGGDADSPDRSGGESSGAATSSRPTATTPAFRVVRATVAVGADGPSNGVEVEDIRAKAGSRIVVTVVSSGYRGEVHLHGFDIHRDVAPGEPAVFDLPPKTTAGSSGQGTFELELEAISTPIARLYVSP